MNELRDEIIKMFSNILDTSFAHIGLEHTLAVVAFSSLLAQKRQLSQEAAMAAAYLHDIATYTSHYANDHATRSAKMAKEILDRYNHLFDEQTKQEILSAIAHHSNKDQIDQPLDELLKDADVLAHGAIIGCDLISDSEKQRLEKMAKGATNKS